MDNKIVLMFTIQELYVVRLTPWAEITVLIFEIDFKYK